MVDATLYQRLRKLGEPQRYDHTIYIVRKTKINTVGTTPKYNIKIVERGKFDTLAHTYMTSNTQIHDL